MRVEVIKININKCFDLDGFPSLGTGSTPSFREIFDFRFFMYI